MYRIKDGAVQVLLAHPGGPFFQNKDEGSWSIPKGEPEKDEDLLVAAQREFAEETGLKPIGPLVPLRPIQQKGGKVVYAWAFAGDCDTAVLKSNTFTIEWPPRSGRQAEFPENRPCRVLRFARREKENQGGAGAAARRTRGDPEQEVGTAGHGPSPQPSGHRLALDVAGRGRCRCFRCRSIKAFSPVSQRVARRAIEGAVVQRFAVAQYEVCCQAQPISTATVSAGKAQDHPAHRQALASDANNQTRAIVTPIIGRYV